MERWRYNLPEGVSDLLPEAAWQKRRLEDAFLREFAASGYSLVETPAFEYLEVFSGSETAMRQEELVKFIDGQGRILTLRPDGTMPCARVAATRLKDAPAPLRLCYVGQVFHVDQGRMHAATQAGIELLGKKSPQGDAEVIALAARSLKAVGLQNFQFDLGQVAFFKGLVDEAGLTPQQAEEVREAVERKDMLALELLLTTLGMQDKLGEKLMALPQLYGGREVLSTARKLTAQKSALLALDDLEKVFDLLSEQGLADCLSIDLGLVPAIRYYSGVIFRGLTPGLGMPVLGGGRYDQLLGRFGRQMPATGFAVDLPQLLNALQQNNALPVLDLPTIRKGGMDA